MLRVLFGNNWGGRMQDKLLRYVETVADTHDVMAFTEVNDIDSLYPGPLYITNKTDMDKGLPDQIMINQFRELQRALKDTHEGSFASENTRPYTCAKTGMCYERTCYGNALFVRTSGIVVDSGAIFILGAHNSQLEHNSSPRVLQYVVLRYKGRVYIIAHFHGVWYKDPVTGSTKSDGPLRTEQSLSVLTALEGLREWYKTDRVIFGGDFNLDIDTAAIKLLETGNDGVSFPYRNLIREEDIIDTRTPLYRDYDTPGTSLYADYIFVSEPVRVQSVSFDGMQVSDHAHLSVSFS